VGLEGFGPGEIALARFLVASAVLAGYTAVVRLRLSERRDLPEEEFGPWQTIYGRYRKWREEGRWQRIVKALRSDDEVKDS
jgi:hypothetical protein